MHPPLFTLPFHASACPSRRGCDAACISWISMPISSAARERSRQRRALARPLRAIAGLTLGLPRGVEGLARLIGHRISGNLTSGHVCDQSGETVASQRAGRPEKTAVMTVWCAAPLASNARYPLVAADSGLATKAVPSCAAAAPRCRTAEMPAPSMMPPAAITGCRAAAREAG
jgi:hypothetical protein